MDKMFETHQISTYKPSEPGLPNYGELDRLKQLKRKQIKKQLKAKIKKRKLNHNLNQARDLRRAWKYLRETDKELKGKLLQDT